MSRNIHLATILVLGCALGEVATAHAGGGGAAPRPRSTAKASPPQTRLPPGLDKLKAVNGMLRQQVVAGTAQGRQLQALFASFGPLVPADSAAARPVGVASQAAAPVAAPRGFSFRRFFGLGPAAATAEAAPTPTEVAPSTVAAPAAGRPGARVWARYDELLQDAAETIGLVAGSQADYSVLRLTTFTGAPAKGGGTYVVALDATGELRIVTPYDKGLTYFERNVAAADFTGFDGSTLSAREVKRALDQLPATIAAASRDGTLKDLLMTYDDDD